jgi:hypothetical protein
MLNTGASSPADGSASDPGGGAAKETATAVTTPTKKSSAPYGKCPSCKQGVSAKMASGNYGYHASCWNRLTRGKQVEAKLAWENRGATIEPASTSEPGTTPGPSEVEPEIAAAETTPAVSAVTPADDPGPMTVAAARMVPQE